MIYLSQMLGLPVVDSEGEQVGTVNDLGIATGEVFPRVTSLAFVGPGKTPFMISWRKYVEDFDGDAVRLKVPATDIRFSYLQPEEVLINRDLMNKQIVDTRGLRVVRVNDLKLSDSGSSQLRLLGAEVGARGVLRGLSPHLESLAVKVGRVFGHELPEKIIAWSYMDLLDRELSDVQLNVSHKTLDDMHPADIADILEQLDPRLRGQVFAQLDDVQAAEAMAELDDDEMAAEIMDEMNAADASRMLSEMDPDDAAELVSELDYERAETLLRLMGVKEERAIRQLLGYREDTAGRIMTSEFIDLPPTATVRDAIEAIRSVDTEEVETVNYIYVTDADRRLLGVLSLRTLLIEPMEATLSSIMETDVICADPEDDQEDVAEAISKYNLLAIPVATDQRRIVGIVTTPSTSSRRSTRRTSSSPAAAPTPTPTDPPTTCAGSSAANCGSSCGWWAPAPWPPSGACSASASRPSWRRWPCRSASSWPTTWWATWSASSSSSTPTTRTPRPPAPSSHAAWASPSCTWPSWCSWPPGSASSCPRRRPPPPCSTASGPPRQHRS